MSKKNGVRIVRYAWSPNRAQELARKGGIDGLRDAGRQMLEKGRKIVPLEDGDLANSAFLADDGESLVVIGYDTKYAVRLHENRRYHFAGSGRAKYLEDTVNGNLRLITAAESRRLAAAFR